MIYFLDDQEAMGTSARSKRAPQRLVLAAKSPDRLLPANLRHPRNLRIFFNSADILNLRNLRMF
jgi:hypothetical protein